MRVFRSYTHAFSNTPCVTDNSITFYNRWFILYHLHTLTLVSSLQRSLIEALPFSSYLNPRGGGSYLSHAGERMHTWYQVNGLISALISPTFMFFSPFLYRDRNGSFCGGKCGLCFLRAGWKSRQSIVKKLGERLCVCLWCLGARGEWRSPERSFRLHSHALYSI